MYLSFTLVAINKGLQLNDAAVIIRVIISTPNNSIIFVIITISYSMKLVSYYNGFEMVSYSKAKDLSFILPVISHTPLTPVSTTCMRVTGLRHINPFNCISSGFHSARARPCGANAAAGLHRYAAHRGEEEDA